MDNIRKEISKTLQHVSQLTEYFLRKYPQFSSPSGYQSYGYPYSSYPSQINNQYPQNDSWQNKYSQQNSYGQITKHKKDNNKSRPILNQPKKSTKQIKKYERKLQSLQQQRQKQEEQRKRSSKPEKAGKKKIGVKLKDLIKKDSRYAQKPKFPLSPYFLFLRDMRNNPPQNLPTTITSHTQFAQQMGRLWRQMPQQKKRPFITNYIKQKKIYDEQSRKFYEKYPDLKPKGYNYSREQKPIYPVNDPKYQHYQQDTHDNEEPLEDDILGELPSEESKESAQMQMNKRNNSYNQHQYENNAQEYFKQKKKNKYNQRIFLNLFINSSHMKKQLLQQMILTESSIIFLKERIQFHKAKILLRQKIIYFNIYSYINLLILKIQILQNQIQQCIIRQLKTFLNSFHF